MSFFNLSDNSNAKDTGTDFEVGGNAPPIPEGTVVTGTAETVAWAEYQGVRHIAIRWAVVKPAMYEGRKIFQKLHVCDAKETKADKYKRMLVAMLKNAGPSGQKVLDLSREPTSEDLELALANKIMNLKLAVWELKDADTKEVTGTGNWISAVGARGSSAPVTKKEAPKPDPQDQDIDF